MTALALEPVRGQDATFQRTRIDFTNEATFGFDLDHSEWVGCRKSSLRIHRQEMNLI